MPLPGLGSRVIRPDEARVGDHRRLQRAAIGVRVKVLDGLHHVHAASHLVTGQRRSGQGGFNFYILQDV